MCILFPGVSETVITLITVITVITVMTGMTVILLPQGQTGGEHGEEVGRVMVGWGKLLAGKVRGDKCDRCVVTRSLGLTFPLHLAPMEG